MALFTDASPPPALGEEPLPHDNDVASFDVVLLDDEGFPSQLPGSETPSETSSFATDFYRCGTDWSSLLSPEVSNNRHRDFERDSGKKMKQANLFQIWGFNRNDAGSPVESGPSLSGYSDDGGGSSERKFVKPGDWGSVLRDTGKDSEHTKSFSKRKGFSGENRGQHSLLMLFGMGVFKGAQRIFLVISIVITMAALARNGHMAQYIALLSRDGLFKCVSRYIHPLEFNTEHVIDGVKVTLLEANHCPGAALIHFGLPDDQCYLHTGDFRACKPMQAYHLLVNQRVNVLYLDTTYCNPKYRFPSKEDVLNYVVKITKNHLKIHPRTLVVVGAYSIGKECVYLSISKALGVKIYANASRRRILQAFGWPDLSDRLCTKGNNTLLHVLPMSSLRLETLKDYLKTYKEQFTAVLAFRPTGWTFSEKISNDLELIKPVTKGSITIYGVPYSEHSSFTELRDFVQFLRPDKIIPTVNVGNAANREKMQSYFQDCIPYLKSIEQKIGGNVFTRKGQIDLKSNIAGKPIHLTH
ncbi:unnamed protein product [Sphenostylis stenocarpa]|uniref:DNA repair metallo-beta-lactamase domain-containing protein n=1 Tax=Sphenostylis stenocarpa TaxID=92480 RepID=A0AA86RL64_9FABA|nr:unnamed protein product [Sphenostylis stenocarpa]